MSKFFSNFHSSFFYKLTLCLVCGLLFQGCGGSDRTDPYNPTLPSSACSSSSSSSSSNNGIISIDTSSSSSSSVNNCYNSSSSSSSTSSSISSSSSSSLTTIFTELVWSGNSAKVIDKKEKNIQFVQTAEEFNVLLNKYVDGISSSPDFNLGQVVLIDDGEVDSCLAHLTFNSAVSANEVTANSVKITVNYLEKPAISNCSSVITRPFSFYYIETRKSLIYEQKIVP